MRTRSLLALLSLAALSLVAGQARAVDQHVDIAPSDKWLVSNLTVEYGKCYKITAEGKWAGRDGKICGPEGTCPLSAYSLLGPQPGLSDDERDRYYYGQNPRNALIARFDSPATSNWSFLVGKSVIFIAPVSGKIHFSIADDPKPSPNRAGKLAVTFSEYQPKWTDRNGNTSIFARIDATDFLHVTPDGISWTWGGSWGKVGLHDGFYPTIVNGIYWWPDWIDGKNTATLLVKELCPKDPAQFRLLASKCVRGSVTRVQGGGRAAATDITLNFSDKGGGSSEAGCTINVPVSNQLDEQDVFLPARPAGLPVAGTTSTHVPPAQPRSTPKKSPIPEPKANEPIDFPVTCAKPDPAFKPSPPPTDPNQIERPDYQTQPKPLQKSLTSATCMMVRISDDGDELGFTRDVIATVNPDSRRSEEAGIGILRADGDPDMKTALEEALRAVRLRYPTWGPGHIDLSFAEKSVRHGGPSAGAAFALLMLSTLEGFDLDPRCALTGDITVDWKVRKVGGVTAKLHGAALDKCLYAAIPEDNQTAFADMALLYGTSALYNIQVFSIATLQDANNIARKDRPEKLAQAIKLFADLQPDLAKNEKQTLQKPETKTTLKKILELAPNHLSARYLLAIAEGKASKTLSASATLYRLNIIEYPYDSLLDSDQKIDRTTLPASVTLNARKQLAQLRPIAHKDYLQVLTDETAFIEAMDQFALNPTTSTLETLKTRLSEMNARADQVNNDKNLRASILREGY